MIKNTNKDKVSELIKKATKKGLIKTYSEYCNTEESKKTALKEDEIIYYTSKDKGEDK